MNPVLRLTLVAIGAPCLCALLGATEPTVSGDPAFLGVRLAPVPEALAAHLKTSDGALIEDVVPGSPAETAGLRRNDMVVNVNGNALKSPDELRSLVIKSKPGEALKLGVLRGGETITVEATLGAFPAEGPAAAAPAPKPVPEQKPRGFLGIGPAEVPEVLSAHLGLKEGAGVVVGDVLKESPAEKAGIGKNDVIVSVDGKAIEGTQDFLRTMAARKAGDEVSIDLLQKGAKRTVKAVLASRPKEMPDDQVFPVLPRWGMRQGPGMGRDPQGGRFGQPFHQGRILLQGPDGESLELELPGAIWKADDLLKDLETRIEKFKGSHLPEMKEHLRKALKDMEEKLGDGPAHGTGKVTRSENSVATVSTTEDGLTITIQDRNGIRTVTVEKDGKGVAKDLPWDQLGTLPEDIRGKVERLGSGLHTGPALTPGGPDLHEEDGKIKA